MFVGLWVCVFVLVHVIVGVLADMFLCLCVFMLCDFVSVAILRTQLYKRRDILDVCVLSSSVYFSDAPLHGSRETETGV